MVLPGILDDWCRYLGWAVGGVCLSIEWKFVVIGHIVSVLMGSWDPTLEMGMICRD